MESLEDLTTFQRRLHGCSAPDLCKLVSNIRLWYEEALDHTDRDDSEHEVRFRHSRDILLEVERRLMPPPKPTAPDGQDVARDEKRAVLAVLPLAADTLQAESPDAQDADPRAFERLWHLGEDLHALSFAVQLQLPKRYYGRYRDRMNALREQLDEFAAWADWMRRQHGDGDAQGVWGHPLGDSLSET
jgi:hypothetical protein